jgi:hypothetical protein
MSNLTLVPITPEQKEIINIRKRQSLQEEINMLRGAMRLMYDCLTRDLPDETPEQKAKRESFRCDYITVLTHTSDSLVRALLAELRLSHANNEIAEVRTEIKRIFQILDWHPDPDIQVVSSE